MPTKLRKGKREARSGPDPIYDWDKILDGVSSYVLREGKRNDYSCQTSSMVTLVKREAKKRKLRVSVYLWYGKDTGQFSTNAKEGRKRNSPKGITIVNKGPMRTKKRSTNKNA